MHIIRKTLQALLFINSMCFFPKELQGIELKVNTLYDELETKNIQFKDLKEITNLYEYSIRENIQTGILRGLYALQRHYLDEENYTLSLYYGQQAEDLALLKKDHQMLGAIYIYMGEIFIKLGVKLEARKFLNLAKKQVSKIDDKTDRNIQLSCIYMQLATLNSNKQNKDSAITYYQKSLNILGKHIPNNASELQKAQFFYLHVFNNMNIGNLYINYHAPPQIKKAEQYFHKTLNLINTNPRRLKNITGNVYFSVAHFYFVKKNYTNSINYLNKTLQAEKRNHNPELRLLSYRKLKNSYDSLGKNDERNKYSILYNKLNDSILSFKHKFDFLETNELQLSSLFIPKHNLFTNPLPLSFTIVLLTSLIGFFFYKRKKNYSILLNQVIQNNHPGNISRNTQSTNINNSINKDITSEKEKEIIKKMVTFEASKKFLKKDISLSYLSHQFNTNPKYLSLIINKHKELNFNGYINKLRINYILDKLLNTPQYRKYKIVSLSKECGYASPQVFINAFKKETGMTPSYFISNLKTYL